MMKEYLDDKKLNTNKEWDEDDDHGCNILRDVNQYVSNNQWLQRTEWVYRYIDRFFKNEAYKKERKKSLIDLYQNQYKKLIKIKEKSEIDNFK